MFVRKIAKCDENILVHLAVKIKALQAESENMFLSANKKKRLRRIINKVRRCPHLLGTFHVEFSCELFPQKLKFVLYEKRNAVNLCISFAIEYSLVFARVTGGFRFSFLEKNELHLRCCFEKYPAREKT